MSCRSSFSFIVTARARTRVLAGKQYRHDRVRDSAGGRVGTDDGDRALAGLRQLQGGELAAEQLAGKEMTLADGDPAGQQGGIGGQDDHPCRRASAQQQVPVAPPQRGAGDHRGLAVGDPRVHPRPDRLQPRPAVLVGQRDAGPHLRDVRGRMELIRVGETPVQPPGDQGADRRLAASRHASQDQDHAVASLGAGAAPRSGRRRSRPPAGGGTYAGHDHENVAGHGASALCRYRLGAGQVERRAPVPAGLFAEGICRVGDVIWQLTWRERVALRWDARTMELTGQVPYNREGWGICAADGYLVTSDGSSELVWRDPEALRPQAVIRVRCAGRRVQGLNDLAWSAGTIWANVAGTCYLAGVDPESGEVTDVVNAQPAREWHPGDRQAIMNGIAALPESGEFLLTGKGWRAIRQVRLRPARDRPAPGRLLAGVAR